MKRLTPEGERQLLHDCIVHGEKDKLVQQYWNLVYYSIHQVFEIKNIPFTQEDVEDLRSEVFIQLFQKECRRLKQYGECMGRSLSAWIALIANRITLNFIRKKGFDSISWQFRRIHIGQEFIPSREKKELEDKKKEQLDLIQDNMEKLAPGDRLILKLHYNYDLSLEEVASFTHRTVGATYTAKSRAMDRLKRLVKRPP
ncbi:MAG: sigma-70 family RNA polymerase sigma factor [Desulfobacterales bacterium]|nr:sigma-70 family RNA polymerase sigma factor [Desulfobacterales bacterium]